MPIILRSGVLATILALSSWGPGASAKRIHGSANADEAAYFGMGQLKGTVWILDEKSGKEPLNGAYVVFQRTDCPKSVVAVRSDLEGHYTVFLSEGKYKVIMRGGTREGETYDILAQKQPRYVQVTAPPNTAEFDINAQQGGPPDMKK